MSPSSAGHLSSRDQFGAFLLSDADVLLHLLSGRLVNEWTHVRVLSGAVTQTQPVGRIRQAAQKSVVNLLVQDQAAGGGATLARRAEGTPEHPFERQVEIRIVHDDHGVLSAHLQRQPLVHAAAGLADQRSSLGRAGKRDDRYLRMLDQCLPYRLSPAMNQLNDFRGKSGLEQDLHQDMNGMGNVLGGLDDHRVPAQQRGKHFPGGDRQRES